MMRRRRRINLSRKQLVECRATIRGHRKTQSKLKRLRGRHSADIDCTHIDSSKAGRTDCKFSPLSLKNWSKK